MSNLVRAMIDTASYPLRGKRVWVAGHGGMVGAALCRRLESEPCDVLAVPRADLDLRNQAAVDRWMAAERPDLVFVAAAKVGGILANDTYPADFLYDNLIMEANIIHAAHNAGVEKLVFLGSSCIYPRLAPQPMAEDSLLTGPLEETNQWYAVAKIAGIKLCQAYRRQHGRDFISAMPTNLYGTQDNFDPHSSHVVPALMAKMHAAKTDGAASVEVWGTGTPKRELLYVDDCADALVHLAQTYSGEDHVNVGTGQDLTIAEIARTIAQVVGFGGVLKFDTSKPDGTPCKLLDIERLSDLGWRPRTGFADGLARTYRWFLEHKA